MYGKPTRKMDFSHNNIMLSAILFRDADTEIKGGSRGGEDSVEESYAIPNI